MASPQPHSDGRLATLKAVPGSVAFTAGVAEGGVECLEC